VGCTGQAAVAWSISQTISLHIVGEIGEADFGSGADDAATEFQAAQRQSGSLPDRRAHQARQWLAQQTDRRTHALKLGCRTLIGAVKPFRGGHGSSLTNQP
jgi:hypothetical protein